MRVFTSICRKTEQKRLQSRVKRIVWLRQAYILRELISGDGTYYSEWPSAKLLSYKWESVLPDECVFFQKGHVSFCRFVTCMIAWTLVMLLKSSVCMWLLQGDILSTAAGGTSVVFRDVEVIKQKSPGDRWVSAQCRSVVLHISSAVRIFKKFRMESNSYFSIRFDSKRAQLFEIFEYLLTDFILI